MSAPGNTWSADIRKEIRFAVVLYGGVSLAIYISGVVRELLAMVRATSPLVAPDGTLTGALLDIGDDQSLAFYRKLANLLNQPLDGEGTALDDHTVYTRFVVDVVSGTSAGGLNGIYLAKALAHGQTLEKLRDFWVNRGDISLLLNSKDKAPRSVLNGQKMLRWLQDAFVGMTPAMKNDESPWRALVDDVQCFATTTDLRGLPLLLRLSDMTLAEQRFRNVYRFAFSNGTWRPIRNDFFNNDALLSLAARSTSSFPGAFAPARLGDLDPALEPKQRTLGFPDYGQPDPGADDERYDPARHAFADGGILNNKPFSHAIAALGSRRGGKPSERKLVYVEPSPELLPGPLPLTDDPTTPGFFSVVLSGLTLPSNQTIREDLERVYARNRLIERMNGVLSDIPHEVRAQSAITVAALRARVAVPGVSVGEKEKVARLLQIADRSDARVAGQAFVHSDVGDLVEIYGLGYAGYHRLKVASVTDDLTTLITQLSGIATDSGDWAAVRYFVRAWRDINFAPYTGSNVTIAETARLDKIRAALGPDASRALAPVLENRRSENAFLFDYDLRFGLRRLDYVLNKIDDLVCMDDRARTVLRAFGIPDDDRWMSSARREELTRLAAGLGAVHALIQWRIEALGNATEEELNTEQWYARIAVLSNLPEQNRPARPEKIPFTSSLGTIASGLGIKQEDRRRLLTLAPTARDSAAIRAVSERFDMFENAARALAERVSEASRLASRWSQNILPPARDLSVGGVATPGGISGGDIARFFYDHFEAVDRITFPTYYQTDVGEETDIVGIVRISPNDSSAIAAASVPGAPVHKLGGETLGHFGGFFAPEWRRSDYLWGQLDGAERLVTSVCAGVDGLDEKRARELVREAQVAILSSSANVEGMPALAKLTTGEDRYQLLEKTWATQAAPDALKTTLATAIGGAVAILGKIVKQDRSTVVGAIARWVGPPLLILARTVVSDFASYTFVLATVLTMMLGGWLTVGSIVAISSGASGLPSSTWHAVIILLRAMAGLAIIGVTLLAIFVRSRLEVTINGVIASVTTKQS